MATLVLTAVGSVVGGPIGAAIGSIIGQQADARLFAPKARQGPRLGDLAVQTSSYGSQIPKIFGRMRVAGTVIWSTDLKERRQTSGGGKGRPKSVQYSYSASFAVALSGRPISSGSRIWADGKLLRGAEGDLKSEGDLRLHLGEEDQAPDPLIAAVEGIGQTPAFRGIAYAVFEDLQLSDFGNRIPSLTFEVVADADPIAIGAVAASLSEGAVTDGGTPLVKGYAASGDSVRSAIAALSDVVPIVLSDTGSSLALGRPDGVPIEISGADAGASSGDAGGRSLFARKAGAGPRGISIAYHDPARDFQTGLQRAWRGSPAGAVESIALPAALDADTAKSIAEARLASAIAGRATAKLHLTSRRSMIRPGALARIEGQGGRWRVQRWTLNGMVVSLDLMRVAEAAPLPAIADPGRAVAEQDVAHGPTTLHLMDLPIADAGQAGDVRLLAAAAGGSGWKRAALSLSRDGGASWESAGPTAAPAVMGHAIGVLPPAGAALFDRASTIEVELLNDEMWLESRTEAALASGANLALIGDELLQFGSAVPTGARRFTLSRLLRGRRGTEQACGTHMDGDRFVLIDPDSLAAIDLPAAAIGGAATVSAQGLGDAVPAVRTISVEGAALRPPSPVHLRAAREGADVRISWVRRSRSGWTWLSGGDTPLGEEAEAYRLVLSGAGFQRTAETAAPHFIYSDALRSADGASGVMNVSVMQLGTWAQSRPASATVLLP